MAPSFGPQWLTNTELGASVIETITERKLLEVGLVALMGGSIGIAAFEQNVGSINKVPDVLKNFLTGPIGELEQVLGAPIFQSFLQSALGVNLSDSTGQEAQAVRMIERAIGFGAGIPILTGGVAGWLETKFGNHAPKELFKAMRAYKV